MRTSILPVWAQTLKFKILALTAAAAACAALGATQVVLQTTEADVQRMLMQAHGHDREQTAALFSNKIEMLQGALIAAARQIRTETWKRPDAMADTLRGNAALSTMFDVVFAAGPTGLTTARLERGEVLTGAVNLADREYFRRVMQFDQPVISRPAVDGDNRAPLVVIAVPVLARDGTTVGTVAGTLALGSNRLFASLNAAAEREGTRDLVIDRDGVILAHPQTGRLLGRAIDEPGLGPVITAWLQRGSPIDTTGEAVVSGQHLVSLAGIPHTDWLLVRMTPIDRALEPVAAARRTGWLAAAAVALFAGLLGGGLAWLMIRPISQLRLRVERLLAQAAPLDEPWPQSHGELGALSRAFRQVFERARVRQADGHALLQRLEAVLEHAEVGIALSRDGRFELVSRQLCHIFRCDPPQLIGQATSSIHASPDAYQAFSERALPDFMAKGAFDGELELMRSGGERFWAHMRGRAVTPGDRSKGTIWIIEDVTEAHAQRERLVWTASHDALTGLMNRRAFEARLGEAAARCEQHPFCALFIDLDRFKQVNDTGGHAAGDALLRDIGQLLVAQVRKSDTVARLGGDEFAVLLDECPLPKAQLIAERMRAAVVEYRLDWNDGARFSVGASIGLLPVDAAFAGAGMAAVLAAADAACYAAKRQGRNCVALGSANDATAAAAARPSVSKPLPGAPSETGHGLDAASAQAAPVRAETVES
jgi:diguanylate cyclase